MILVVYGTRPEFIKIKPLLDELRKNNILFKTLFTGQHKDIVSKEADFKISIDEKLEYEKLEQEYEKSEEDEKKLEALNNYELILEKKYLPNPYICKLDLIKFENETEFRRGLSVGLYNQEVQYYNIEEIEITNNFDSPNTILTFKAFWSID